MDGLLCVAAFLLIFCRVFGVCIIYPSSTVLRPNTTVAFVGDLGVDFITNSGPALDLVHEKNATLTVLLGDHVYESLYHTQWGVDYFISMLRTRCPNSFFVATVGNHDEPIWSTSGQLRGLAREITKLNFERAISSASSCYSEFELWSICSVDGFAVLTSSEGVLDMTKVTSVTPNYIVDAFANYPKQIRICGIHRPPVAFQTLRDFSPTPIEIYQQCLDSGDIIAAGDDHKFLFTNPLDGVNPPSWTQNGSAGDIPSDPFIISDRSMIMTVSGLGGKSEYAHMSGNEVSEWWSATFSRANHLVAGVLFATFYIYDDPSLAEFWFETIDHQVVFRKYIQFRHLESLKNEDRNSSSTPHTHPPKPEYCSTLKACLCTEETCPGWGWSSANNKCQEGSQTSESELHASRCNFHQAPSPSTRTNVPVPTSPEIVEVPQSSPEACLFSGPLPVDIPGFGMGVFAINTLDECRQVCCENENCMAFQFSLSCALTCNLQCILHDNQATSGGLALDFYMYLKLDPQEEIDPGGSLTYSDSEETQSETLSDVETEDDDFSVDETVSIPKTDSDVSEEEIEIGSFDLSDLSPEEKRETETIPESETTFKGDTRTLAEETVSVTESETDFIPDSETETTILETDSIIDGISDVETETINEQLSSERSNEVSEHITEEAAFTIPTPNQEETETQRISAEEEVIINSNVQTSAPAIQRPTASPTLLSSCSFESGGWRNDQIASSRAESKEECCDICEVTPQCSHFQYNYVAEVCRLHGRKASKSSTRQSDRDS